MRMMWGVRRAGRGRSFFAALLLLLLVLDFAGLRWLGNEGMGGIGAQGISGIRLQEEVIEGLCVPWNLLER